MQNTPYENALYETAVEFYQKRDFAEAEKALRQTLALNPLHLGALLHIAQIYRAQGAFLKNNDMLQAALDFFNRAIAIRPDEDTYLNIGFILELQGNYRALIETSEACLARYPNSVRSLLATATYHDHFQKYEEALKYFEKALAIEPGNGEIYAHMATTLKELGRVDEAISMQKKALELSPDKPWIYSNMLLAMVYASSVSPEELADTSRLFGERIADRLIRKRPFQNDKNPNRKLRIGYVSADFRGHAVAFFLAPIYHCNKENFELFAYSKTQQEDSITNFMKQFFDGWRDIKFLNDDNTADLIEKDKIDILVDLAGHTGHNSLPVFARKPAPVQVSWLGYPATTGMKAMDYRITDSYAEPEDMTEHLNVERLWRLPDIFCAYLPHPGSPAVIDHPPFEDNGHITFGCFNNFTKVTDDVLRTWAKVMANVPNSHFLLEIAGIESEKICTEVEERLKKHGLPIDRLILKARSSANQFVLYNKIDIALDPYPCNGGTTSFDTLWMGVPLVSLAGKHFVSRMGVTVLTNAGLPELIAQDTEEYIRISSDLANDRDRLRDLRKGLREKFAASPAMDRERFARNMENAFREMWKKWVEGASQT